MRRSIRWTLLGWYAAILIVVIGGLGIALFVRQRTAALERVDAELVTHALAIAGAIEHDEHDGFEFELRDEYRAHFRQSGEDAPYFVIWGPKGEAMVRSPSAPTDIAPGPPGLRQVGYRREVASAGPEDTHVIVGRGTQGLEGEIASFGWTVLVAGLVALGVALLGGWFLVSRVLAPIQRISQTASRISASNLRERIDLGRTESELGALAATLNQAFDRLRAAVESQVRFTADASHELRTPLAVLQASAEWALRSERSQTEYVDTLNTCLGATKRMTRLVEDLLTLARSDADDLPMREGPVDLESLVEDTTAFLAPLAAEREVDVECTLDPAPTTGDPTRLRGALTSLLANGIQHNRRGGRLEVRTGLADGAAVVEVTDTGPGIPDPDLPRVFERFYRVDSSRSERGGGTGLGLAIAREIVEAHRGEIHVESRVGEGTTFRIQLPSREPGGS